MILCTVQFNYADWFDYARLLKVFRESVRVYNPDIRFLDIRIDPPMQEPGDTRARNFLYNTVKLEKWREVIETADEPVILADCDMLQIRPIDMSVWDQDFDVAYTERTETRTVINREYWGPDPIRRMPLNGGIILVKPTEAARGFFREFETVNRYLYDHPREHKKWNVKYSGMNQAAFGYLMETGDYKAKVVPIPCRIWNAVDTDWSRVNYSKTIFIHIKSRLRRLILSGHIPYGNFKDAMIHWYKTEEQL